MHCVALEGHKEPCLILRTGRCHCFSLMSSFLGFGLSKKQTACGVEDAIEHCSQKTKIKTVLATQLHIRITWGALTTTIAQSSHWTIKEHL